MARPLEDVYCTLVMNDEYLPGAAVLAHSLRDTRTKKKLAVLITLDSLSANTITQLRGLYDYLIPVERIRNPRPGNLFLMSRGDLLHTFTKIALWRQDQFRKIVFLDADVVALRAPDELFDIEAPFAAASDVGWPDCFNTGVMVISPNMGDYWALRTHADAGDSFDGADQGLLNQYYEHKGWHRIDFTYNCTPSAQYQWEPAYMYKKNSISMVHFIGKDKPWNKPRQTRIGSDVYNELLGRWWAVHDRHLKEPTKQSPPARSPPAPSPPTQSSPPSEHTESQAQQVEPQAPSSATEQPLSKSGEPAENIDQALRGPTPTAEQRRFLAQWDATHDPPPSGAKPEASDFPSEQYEFSDSKELFQAPASYPEPPKDMWFEVPETKPAPQERPKPIFPWETDRAQLPPTRVFAEDLPSEPTPALTPDTTTTVKEQGFAPPPSPPSTQVDDPGVQQFAPQANAWDGLEGINRYVRAVQDAQTRKFAPKPMSVLSPSAVRALLSPSGEGDSQQGSRRQRRESLLLTDFPTADDRPSLPVTPAPIRRPTFWGGERDGIGELPAAEGVPDQTEWNPEHKLEELRRNSVIDFDQLKLPDFKKKEAQLRQLPRSSISDAPLQQTSQPHLPISSGSSPHGVIPASESSKEAQSVPPSESTKEAGVVPGATVAGKPELREPDFGNVKSAGSFSAETSGESILSPTER